MPKFVDSLRKLRSFDRFALAFFVFWALFLTFEFWAYGDLSYVKIPDAANASLATRLAWGPNLAAKEFGNWLPDLLGGVDRVAQMESAGFIDLLFLVLPGWLAYAAYLGLQRFLAGFFTYKLLRSVDVSPAFALLPALFYSLYSQRQINLQFDGFTVYDAFGLPAVPLYLFLLGLLSEKLSQSFKPRYVVMAFAAGLLLAHTSSFVFVIFLFPLAAFWLLLVVRGKDRSTWWVFVPFLVGWFLIESYEILGTYTYALASQRNLRESCTGVATTPFLSLQNFFSYYVFRPDNLPLLSLGGLGLVIGWRTSSYRLLLISLGLVLLYCLCAFYIPQFVCSDANPLTFVRGFNYSRFFFYLPFLIAIFGGIGAGAFLDGLDLRRKLPWAPAAFALLAFAWIFGLALEVKQITQANRLAGSNYANLFENPYIQRVAELSAQLPLGRVVTYNPTKQHLSPGFLWPYGINTLDGYTGIYSRRFYDYWRSVLRPILDIEPNCRFVRKLDQGNARVLLDPSCEGALPIDAAPIETLFDFDLLSLSGVRYVVSTVALEAERLRTVDLSSVSCPDRIPRCDDYYVYENPDAFPFLFPLTEVATRANEEVLLTALGSASIETLETRTFLVDEYDIEAAASSAPQQIELIYYSSDRLQIETSADAPFVLAVNWTYSSDWRAWVDGQPARVLAVDYFLMGVQVPAGAHEVEFRYQPKYSLDYWLTRLTRER